MDSLRTVTNEMPDLLLFSESLFCWHLANYTFCNDPALEDREADSADHAARNRWFGIVLVRSGFAALLLLMMAGALHRREVLHGIAIFVGSLLIPLIRRQLPVRFLAEFELAVNSLVVAALWFAARYWTSPAASLPWVNLSHGKISAILLCASVFIYMVRGGGYLVRSILKKAGGMPDVDNLGFESSDGYAHGRMIGQIERIIVVLIVMGGTLQALAFFFAAKGLIRSKELEQRPLADYFLLGSLASFLIALAAGLILQKVVAALWL